MTWPGAKAALQGELVIASLPTKQTNPTETEVSKLEVTVLVNEEVIRLEITAQK